jgi:hypothetical protein
LAGPTLAREDIMKKIMASLVVVTLLSATVATQAFAGGWDRHSHGRAVGFDPLWPIVTALTLPVVIAESIVRATVPPPVVIEPPAPPETVEPQVYSAPPAYYEQESYYAPRTYYTPRTYYAPRGYYPPGYYRAYRYGR